MDAFNRFVMIIIALLLIAVPVLLLLIGFGVLPADQVNAVTNYRGALDSLGGLSVSDFDSGARLAIAIIAILVALIALFLLLRELTFGRTVARRTLIDDTPGRETTITAAAVRRLAEAAAQEVGASDPSCRLSSDQREYNVMCDIRVPKESNFSETAANARQNIRRALEEQQVPLKDVEVTVQGAASQG